MNIPPINISKKALLEIKESFSIKGIPDDYYLRVGIKGGACSANYLLGFDRMGEFDELFNIEGLSVIVDKRHLMYLLDVTLDFEEEGNGFAFIKKNRDL